MSKNMTKFLEKLQNYKNLQKFTKIYKNLQNCKKFTYNDTKIYKNLLTIVDNINNNIIYLNL